MANKNVYYLATHKSFGRADLHLPDIIKLDFRQIQNIHFTAIMSKGKT